MTVRQPTPTHVFEEARRLRKEGWTRMAIAEELGVSLTWLKRKFPGLAPQDRRNQYSATGKGCVARPLHVRSEVGSPTWWAENTGAHTDRYFEAVVEWKRAGRPE